jgi:hypothetical protein
MNPHPTEPQGETPRTDALIQAGPFDGPKQWVDWWDKAIDSHRSLERALSECRKKLEQFDMQRALASKIVDKQIEKSRFASPAPSPMLDAIESAGKTTLGERG